jgi:anthranilate synthase/aminodeoxychorismate synthase-like glutamine amidotransferase
MLILIDNYDSFTYNLFQYFAELGEEVKVLRNDMTTLDAIELMHPARIVVSPGPPSPEYAGISNEVIRHFGPKLPVLGVCLGHQCIGYTYGAQIVRAGKIMHGKTSLINHIGQGVFAGLPDRFSAIRYHSLAVESLPDCLEATAWAEDGTLMGLRHKQYPVEGIQFHPESFMTQWGKEMLRNFLSYGGTQND